MQLCSEGSFFVADHLMRMKMNVLLAVRVFLMCCGLMLTFRLMKSEAKRS